MITADQAMRELSNIRADYQRFAEAARNPRRKMRPSERAMTVAHYEMKIEALDFAVDALKKKLVA